MPNSHNIRLPTRYMFEITLTLLGHRDDGGQKVNTSWKKLDGLEYMSHLNVPSHISFNLKDWFSQAEYLNSI